MNNNYNTLLVKRDGSRLYVTLNRPQARNAITGEMISELSAVINGIRDDRSVRVLIMRGAGGIFCAGGDIKGFKQIFQGKRSTEQIATENRGYGEFLQQLNELPQTVIMLVEGGAIGGGLGMVCVSDIAIATANTRFSLSETSLGIPPAQIAAFVVQRIGFTQARRLMLTASRFKADEAERLGLVHFVVPDSNALEQKAEEMLKLINRCSPSANAVTKDILHSTQSQPLAATLDIAAQHFAKCMQSDEGREGVSAFLEKRKPAWRNER